MSAENSEVINATTFKSSTVISANKRSEKDVGSPEVQVAILTARLEYLQRHLASNPKDFNTQRGMLQMVAARKNHLSYLKSQDVSRYSALIAKLGLRK